MNREVIVTAPDELTETAVRVFEQIRPLTIALSGGHTPRPIYERLASIEYDWTTVDVFFGDERCVPPDHPDSNFGMAHGAFLGKVPARVHPMDGTACAAGEYEKALRSVFGPGVPVFDLVFLGLGDDGHTASLFPGDAALAETRANVVRVRRPDHERLSLTLPVLSAARVALFLVAGASKRPALAQLLGDGDVPAARVSAARTIVIADRDAAAISPQANAGEAL